jgi:hypothetical protein
MSNLIEFHLHAAVRNRGNHMQLNLQNLDTKTGYHEENSLRFDERAQSKKPSGLCVKTGLKRSNNCAASAWSPSEEMAIVWDTWSSGRL